MDQLIVLKGVRVHSASVLREEDGLGGDMTTKYGITNGGGGERERREGRKRKKTKVTTN